MLFKNTIIYIVYLSIFSVKYVLSNFFNHHTTDLNHNDMIKHIILEVYYGYR